jgi:putative ABC transport system substrate-binding protein
MNRRNFIAGSAAAGLVAAVAPGWPGAAGAEQQDRPVIGILDGVWAHLMGAAGSGLRENGMERVHFEHSRFIGRKWDYRVEAMTLSAADLVKRQKIAVMLAFSARAALAAKTVASTVPVVFLAEDPVAAGLVDSLERPGDNLTGVACPVAGLTAKKIDIIRQLVPATRLVVVVTDPTNPGAHDTEVREAEAATSALGLELSVVAWSGEHLFEPELAALPRDRNAVLVFGTGFPFLVDEAVLAYLAARYGFPAIHGIREAVDQGGLVSFGTRYVDGGHLMGVAAARILKGDKPADLPVQVISKTELVINPRAAKSLGIKIPPALLARADEVID